MSTELANVELPAVKYQGDEKQWLDVVSSSAFLPYIQLCGGNSNAVKEGKIPVGHYALFRGKDKLESLTSSYDCLPILWRFKAMKFGETIISYYNPQSNGFKELVNLADNVPDSNCVYGPEFLLWVPSIKGFATMLFGSKTARRESPVLKDLLETKRSATMRSELVKKGKNSWHAPVISPCSTPFEMPSVEDVMAQAERFANPKESEVETAEAATNGRAR